MREGQEEERRRGRERMEGMRDEKLMHMRHNITSDSDEL